MQRQGASPPQEPPSRRTIVIVVLAALAIAIFSSVFTFAQLRRNAHQMAGRVVRVEQSELIIADRRGRETVIVVTEDTRFRDGGTLAEQGIEPGIHIHTFGERLDETTFESHRLRVIRRR